MIPSSNGPRDHLFVSYASEDEAFAKWLALRLTVEGYKVWISCFELLGGERFPEDITRAIKERTFRMLGLLSEHSLHKDDPSGERSMAISLGRERDENFLIPINVDGCSPTDLDFRTIEFNFIPFWGSWADGLAQLLEKLKEIEAPKGAANGCEIAASTYLSDEVLSDQPEPLYANLLLFERIPEVLYCYRPRWTLSAIDRNALANHWAFWGQPGRARGGEYFAFSSPPNAVPGLDRLTWDLVASDKWRGLKSFQNKHPEHILKPLLRRAILHHLRRKGLKPVSTKKSTILYFPRGLLDNDNLSFMMPDGRSTYRKVVGERIFPGSGDTYRYHQAVTVDILRDLESRFVVKFRIKLYVTGPDGERLGRHSANARRKHLTSDWYNKEWLARHLALCAFMSDGDGKIVIGDDDPVVVNGSLVDLEAPHGINEEAIPDKPLRFPGAGGGEEEGAEEGRDGESKDADVAG